MSSAILAAFRRSWAPVLVLVVTGVVYAYVAGTASSELGARVPQDAYYNLMVQGWLKGQTSLALEAPAGLRALPNPYDRMANAAYRGLAYYGPRVHDLSYYHGKLYAYFSPLPAVVLFLPFHLLTGQWLSHQLACLIFCLIGLAAASATLWSLHERFFPATGQDTLAVALLAVGFLNLGPLLLQRPAAWEVPIACAQAAWLLAVWCVWMGWWRPAGDWKWSLAAGCCAAVAIGSRPSTILCGVVLLVPVVRCFMAARENGHQRRSSALVAVLLPLLGTGIALFAFNYARFGSWLEFGQKYQLNQEPVHSESVNLFKASYLFYNLRLYTFATDGWDAHFPFVRVEPLPPTPPGHGGGDTPFGLLSNLPAFWFMLGLRYAWRALPATQRRTVFLFAGLLAVMMAACALPLLLFPGACVRYEFEFAGYGALLAAMGFLAIEAFSMGWTRRLLRVLWYFALFVSVAFCCLETAMMRAKYLTLESMADERRHNSRAAIGHLQEALILDPRSATNWSMLGIFHVTNGDISGAVRVYAQALEHHPDSAVFYANYGYCLMRVGRTDDAMQAFTRALELQPNFPWAAAQLDEARLRTRAKVP